jgi:hypothetical protein
MMEKNKFADKKNKNDDAFKMKKKLNIDDNKKKFGCKKIKKKMGKPKNSHHIKCLGQSESYFSPSKLLGGNLEIKMQKFLKCIIRYA